MKWESERKLINAGFGLALVLLILLSLLTYQLFRTGVENTQWVKHTHLVLEGSKELLSNLKDAETGQRGYIITADEAFLEPFYMALERDDQLFKTLQKLTADNPAQQQRLAEAEKLIREKLAFTHRV
ncbi:MAG TPA: CHASE3 domain-containing protein, partial [Pontibacter sp.]